MPDIFVFGSNLQGRHGKGAALEAKEKWGAIYGIAEGLQGNSYAIPTKETPYKTLALWKIKEYIIRFIAYARLHPEMQFLLTPIGCGLAGYTPAIIAPLFKDAPKNVILPKEFEDVINAS